jgi:acyl-CoA synthetase (AMP-forming)/AMP-acid ligase II
MGQPVESTRNRDDFSNVASALSWQAQRQPNAVAIHYPRSGFFRKRGYTSCTYQELDSLSDSYARGLAAYGIGPGIRTALMLTPGLES